MLELLNITSMHLKSPIKISDPMMIKHASASDRVLPFNGDHDYYCCPQLDIFESSLIKPQDPYGITKYYEPCIARDFTTSKRVFSQKKRKRRTTVTSDLLFPKEVCPLHRSLTIYKDP